MEAWHELQKKSLRASEQDREDVKQQRRSWWRQVAKVARRRFVFLDESGSQTHMKRLYGRTIKGQRLVEAVPGGHWRTTTMISAIRSGGVATAMVTEGAIDALVFRGFVEHFLVPVLARGDIVVMDNLSSHKVSGVREAIERTGAQLWYLPPYSPDLNPIEQAWSKVKSVLRSISPTTPWQLCHAVGTALRRITRKECQNYFDNCGYLATSN